LRLLQLFYCVFKGSLSTSDKSYSLAVFPLYQYIQKSNTFFPKNNNKNTNLSLLDQSEHSKVLKKKYNKAENKCFAVCFIIEQ